MYLSDIVGANSVIQCSVLYTVDRHYFGLETFISDEGVSLLPHAHVEADAYRIAREPTPLYCKLHAAVAVCVHDDTQGVGGVLHLRFAPSPTIKPADLTDNTLSSDLLLLDRFCKELRSQGARKQSWRVNLVGHIPATEGMETPAATLLDLLKAYFADSRLPVECNEVRRPTAVTLSFNPREGETRVLTAADSTVSA